MMHENQNELQSQSERELEKYLKVKSSITKPNNNNLGSIINRKVNTDPFLKDLNLSELWEAKSYSLGGVNFFDELSRENQNKVLSRCATSRLEEAYHIEKCGMAFTAKMTLLSDTIEERKLYSLFSSDEARHLSYIEDMLPNIELKKEDPFLSLLSNIIDNGSRRPLIFIVQILLEGWGIDHYQMMAETCTNINVRTLLHNIVRDEAGHHGSGLILFDEKELSLREKNYIVDTLQLFFQMVQVGPVGIMNDTAEVLGGFNRAQKINFLESIDSEIITHRKLQILKKLMFKSEANSLMEEMETRGAFKAFSPRETVDLLES